MAFKVIMSRNDATPGRVTGISLPGSSSKQISKSYGVSEGGADQRRINEQYAK
jgi:hypothetical protein